MNIDVYAATGKKAGTWELPEELFAVRVNRGLIHQAVTMQQSNRRHPVAYARSRGEVAGSTRKLYAQKHTGRARRGSVRSPLLRGGGKAFGPKRDRNFTKEMPRAMRHAALAACLSLQAKNEAIIGLESYPETVKTKEFSALLAKLPVQVGRKIVLVLPAAHRSLYLSSRNVPNVKTVLASYLNPEDVIGARHLIFLTGAIEKAKEIFTKKSVRVKEAPVVAEEKAGKVEKKPAKKVSPKKKVSSPTA
jgi:large subunit ribosomal protein L4